MARRLDDAAGAVLTAAVTTLEDHRAHVALTQRTLDGVGQRLAAASWCSLVSAR